MKPLISLIRVGWKTHSPLAVLFSMAIPDIHCLMGFEPRTSEKFTYLAPRKSLKGNGMSVTISRSNAGATLATVPGIPRSFSLRHALPVISDRHHLPGEPHASMPRCIFSNVR